MSDTDEGTTDETGTTEPDTDDWAALTEQLKTEGLEPGQVAERLKASRKWEQRAKENSKAADELDALKRSSMSDTEKAVEEAKVEARNEVRAETAARIAAADIKAALTGIVPDPDSIIEDLNLTRYVTEDGEVDAKAVKALAQKYAELAPAKGTADLKQGARGRTSDQTDNNQWLRDKVAARQ